MRTLRILIPMFALAAVLGLYAAEKETVWEGTLVDASCYLKDNTDVGNDHMGVKKCGTTCLQSGLPAGLLTKSKAFHIIVARSIPLAPYVGQEVRITGVLKHEVILASKAEVKKNGKWEAVDIKTMM